MPCGENLIPICSLVHQLGKRGRMRVYESLVRPALFTLPPDLTHAIGHMALRQTLPWRMLAAVTAFDVDDPVLVACETAMGRLPMACGHVASRSNLGHIHRSACWTSAEYWHADRS